MTIELDYTEAVGPVYYVGLIVPDPTDEDAIVAAAYDLTSLPADARTDISVTGDTTVEVTYDASMIDL